MKVDDLMEVLFVAANAKTDEEKAKIKSFTFSYLAKGDITNADDLLEVLFVTSNAKTDEQKARVAWRASDHMWRHFPRYDLVTCRVFNNLLQGQKWPWVEDLWSKEERAEIMARYE
jgi:hypothetical protein